MISSLIATSEMMYVLELDLSFLYKADSIVVPYIHHYFLTNSTIFFPWKHAYFLFSHNAHLTSHASWDDMDWGNVASFCDSLSNLWVDHLLHCKPNMYLKKFERSETWKL